MRLAVPLAIVALAAVLLAGCGGSDSGSTSESGATQPRAGASSAPGRAPGAPAGASARECRVAAGRAARLRVVAASCAEGRRLLLGWRRAPGCGLPAGGSRGACSVGAYRCAAVRAGRGLAVSCARPGRTVSFLARG